MRNTKLPRGPGFYAISDGDFIYANNLVFFPNGTFLSKELKDTYNYPVNGYWWFDSEDSAISARKSGAMTTVPLWITAFQARAALAQAGLLTRVQAYMDTLDTNDLVRIAWDTNANFYRKSPAVSGISQLLNIDSDALDHLFTVAAGISV